MARSRFRRSAGTATPIDVIRRAFRPPSNAAMAGDISAIDRGEGRTVACLYRGSYGALPKRFRRKMLDLTPDALTFRPFWSSPYRSRFRVPRGDIISAARGRANSGTMLYEPGAGFFGWAGFDVIACETAAGKLEIAVPRPDVPLILHYLGHHIAGPDDGSS